MGMILLGIVYGAVTGNMQAVTDAAFASAKDAVTLCITMTGMMALWVGGNTKEFATITTFFN